MKFIIRDDDTSYFTRYEELRTPYGRLWGKIPISLAIIPYDVPSYYRGLPEKYYQKPEPVSIEKNRNILEMISEGVEEKYLQIMLHGYNHLYKVNQPVSYDPKYWIPEFIYTNNMKEKIREGKGLLEKIFNTHISFFVPPSNSISIEGLKAMAASKMDLAGLGGIRNAIYSNPLNFALIAFNRFNLKYPYNIRHFVDHKEIMCHALTPVCDWDNLCFHLDNCKKKNGIFVLATHYWELEREHIKLRIPIKNLLFKLINKAKNYSAQFVGIDNIFD